MEMKKIGTAAKYAGIALAGCAVIAVAAETLSSGGKNDVPILTASDSTSSGSSSKHSSSDIPPSTPSASPASSPSSSVQTSTQSSTSVSTPVSSEVYETSEPPISESEPADEPVISSYVTQEISSELPPESTSEPPQQSEQSEPVQSSLPYIPDFPPELITDIPIVIISTSSSSLPSYSPPVSSSSEAPVQSSEPPVSSVGPVVSVTPSAPDYITVNINTATVAELIQLDGIGEDKALAIIEFRENFGGFTSIYEIRDVDGIGDSTFERIRDYIVV